MLLMREEESTPRFEESTPAVGVTMVSTGDQHQLATAAITSAEVLVRCPRRRLGRRISVWTPPTQWMSRAISAASLSISRRMRFFNRTSVVGVVQTLLRSAASVANDAGSTVDGTRRHGR